MTKNTILEIFLPEWVASNGQHHIVVNEIIKDTKLKIRCHAPSGITAYATDYILGYLPTGYEPSHWIELQCVTSNGVSFLLSVQPNSNNILINNNTEYIAPEDEMFIYLSYLRK